MKNFYSTLAERGFIEQATDPEEMENLFKQRTISAYIGFDPTAESLHVGSLIPIMALAHLQLHGHRPISLVGGGTALIGDPSGKKEMRPVLSYKEIQDNTEGLKKQLARFMNLDGYKGLLLNNMDWLAPLNYVEFLRDIGRHFSVNRMLAAESVKQRLETGLSFIEFNYQLLQAYDFLHLYSHHDCLLQMGGSDQWGNIVAGIDLIRRMKGGKAYGLTFPLIVTSSGEKMGKTAKGTVWLDPGRTTPYDYYQFWINTEDQDVGRFLALFTFLPMRRVRELSQKQGADLREAKEILAFEATAITHGKEKAEKAKKTSYDLFYGQGVEIGAVPTSQIPREKLAQGTEVYLLLVEAGICQTRGEARRLIAQGGVSLNDQRVSSFDQKINEQNLKDNAILLKIGKKRFHKIISQ